MHLRIRIQKTHISPHFYKDAKFVFIGEIVLQAMHRIYAESLLLNKLQNQFYVYAMLQHSATHDDAKVDLRQTTRVHASISSVSSSHVCVLP